MSKTGTSVISYISTGNMSAIGTAALTYYKSNQLATSKPSTNTSTYYYDAFGQRLKIKTTGTEFSADIDDLNGKLLEETNAGVETDYAYLDDMPLSAIQTAAATISALHPDNIGTVQRATNAAKTIVWTGNYDMSETDTNSFAEHTGPLVADMFQPTICPPVKVKVMLP
jgi:YD repeat-containing protein